MHSIHAPPVIGIGETKETRRRSAGSVAEVWALEELDERTYRQVTQRASPKGSWGTTVFPIMGRLRATRTLPVVDRSVA